MSNCSVASCRNYKRFTDLHKKDISYHRFPKNEEIRQKWLKAVQPRKAVTENHSVCSAHFLKDDFEKNLQAELLSLPQKRRLKPTAVPSLHMDESDKGNIENITKEIYPFVTCEYYPQKTAENPITTSEPNIKVIIQRIDSLERNNELLISQKFVLLNSKNGPCLKGKDSQDDQPPQDTRSKNSTPVVPTTNLMDHIHNTESNSITNIYQDMDGQRLCSKEADKGTIKCRTCLEDMQMCHFLMDVVHATKTIKEMIIFLVPQMASTLSDDDLICSKCLDAIQFCVNFIENCLKVEKKLQAFSRKENAGECEDQEVCNSLNTIDYIKIDHDYVTKSEPQRSDDFTQPRILESLLINHQQANSTVDKSCTELNHQQLFKCPSCNSVLKSQKFLLNHIIREHTKIPTDDETKESLMALSSNKNCQQEEKFLERTKKNCTELNHQQLFKCPSCNSVLKSQKFLENHIIREHSKMPTDDKTQESLMELNSNKMCQQEEELLERTKKNCTELNHQQLFKCPSCNSVFKSGEFLLNHIIKEHSKIPTDDETQESLIVLSSNKMCQQEEELPERTKKNCIELNQQRLFKCPSCNRVFKSQKFLENHILREHSKMSTDDESQKSLMELNSNKMCRQEERTGRERFYCEICGRLFKTERYLLIHLSTVHNLLKRPTTESMKEVTNKVGKVEKKYVCNFCKRSFLKAGNYKFHLKKHNEKVLETCTICDLKFRNKQELAAHRRQHGITCGICFKMFSTREEINKHRETHREAFFCKVCGKGFKMKQSLRVHAKGHGAYCFYCSVCGKGFTSNGLMRYHMIIHDPEKKLKCDRCPSTFQDKSKLNLHQRVVHEKIKEYQCVECGKKFGMRTSLKSHYRLKHLKLKTYQCENCGKRFGRRDNLKVHSARHYKEAKREQNIINATIEVESETLEESY